MAQAWVALEDNGPWGKKAPGTARFGSAPELARLSSGTACTVLLVRQPDVRVTGQRRVWVAHVATQSLRVGTVEDPDELLDWDFEAIAAGTPPPALERSDQQLWLVCTNSSRDACCALVGRPLVDDLHGLAVSAGVLLLESSHLGGHRFAPTALGLPSGYAFGRLSVASATAALTALTQGEVLIAQTRGLTRLDRVQQAAELAARAHLGWTAVAGLSVAAATYPAGPTDAAHVDVSTSAGTVATVEVTARELAPRPESCEKGPVPGVSYDARVIG